MDISWMTILFLFVAALAVGAGWTLGCWLMSRLIGALTRQKN